MLRRLRARAVEEREWKDGELVEISRDFHARCERTGDMDRSGEDIDICVDGGLVSRAGAWRAGRGRALPGLSMPGACLLGSRHCQEFAPGVAQGGAEHVRMGLALNVPAGAIERCAHIVDTSPLDPGAESVRRSRSGVGLVADDVVALVAYDVASHHDGDDDDDDRRGHDHAGDDWLRRAPSATTRPTGRAARLEGLRGVRTRDPRSRQGPVPAVLPRACPRLYPEEQEAGPAATPRRDVPPGHRGEG